ncbi:MAG: methyltransferase domain-containing protein [Elusimicrobia bacterium]|nr:methyltransferase domain-containing protein [Elusimicrobiota bacterium]
MIAPLVGFLLAAAPCAAAQKTELESFIESQDIRRPEIERVLDRLDLKPGQTVLDIGAGPGLPAFKIAERLKGQGEVFATEVVPEYVEHMRKQAKLQGLSNVHAVLVSTSGVDAFYGAHRYDLVLVYRVLWFIRDRETYFAQIRNQLTPKGRVAVVTEEYQPAMFTREDFVDMKGFVTELMREPAESPFGRELRALLPRLQKTGDEKRDNEMLSRAAIFSLNRLLSEPSFFLHFVDGGGFRKDVSFTPEERTHAMWQLHLLQSEGLPNVNVPLMRYSEYMGLQHLNKLLMIQRFRKHLASGGRSPYLASSPEGAWQREKDPVRREFEAAGYQLEKKHDLAPFLQMSVFQPR